ncbi:hypothetical protein MBLNU459_g2646t1 [Dothideomycetes sp. NU459]
MPHSTTLPREQETCVQPKLYVNDGPLDDSSVGRLRPSYPDEPLEELRSRYQEDGYLFLKGLLPRSDVLKARSSYFSYLSPSGVLAPGTTPEQGIFDASKDAAAFPGIGAGVVGNNNHGGPEVRGFVDLALEAHTQDWYAQEFCKHPALRDFVAKFTDWGQNTLGIRRTLLRNNVPGNKAIGVHYDQIFLRHGRPTSVTAWVPMGDVSINGGGLIYLEKGHTLGAEQEETFTRKAMASGLTEEEAKNGFNANMMSSGMLDEGPARYGKRFDRRWLVTDYEAGDVVLHTPFTIHASTLNNDPENVIRLATDLRFVDSTKPWDTRWDKDYEIGDGV